MSNVQEKKSKKQQKQARRNQRDAAEIQALSSKIVKLDQKIDQASKKKKNQLAAQLRVIQQGETKLLRDYIRCLINPQLKNAVRIPDTFQFPTALVHSRHVIEVSGNFYSGNEPGDMGRFCSIVSPTMGVWPFVSQGNDWFALGDGLVTYADFDTAQGAHVASVSSVLPWVPDTLFKPSSPMASASLSNVKGKPIPFEPIGPTVLPWDYSADPNSDIILGTYNPVHAHYEGGMAEQLRPVAMSVWFQCTLPEINNGGDVAACLLPGGSIMGNICPYNFTSAAAGTGEWGTQGPLVNWENLASFPGAYAGKLKDGTFSYYVPGGYADITMLDAVEHQTHDFPSIIVSGQAMASGGVSPGIVGKLEIETIWEYSTSSQIPLVAKGACFPGLLDQAKCALYNEPTSMANGEHVAWWKRLLASGAAGIGGFLIGGPAGSAAAAGAVFNAL